MKNREENFAVYVGLSLLFHAGAILFLILHPVQIAPAQEAGTQVVRFKLADAQKVEKQAIEIPPEVKPETPRINRQEPPAGKPGPAPRKKTVRKATARRAGPLRKVARGFAPGHEPAPERRAKKEEKAKPSPPNPAPAPAAAAEKKPEESSPKNTEPKEKKETTKGGNSEGDGSAGGNKKGGGNGRGGEGGSGDDGSGDGGRGSGSRYGCKGCKGNGDGAPHPKKDWRIKYKKKVMRKIQAAKRYPYAAQKEGMTGKVVVRFTISSDGELLSVRVVTPCEYPILNEDAVKWIHRAAPFPSFPAEAEESRMSFKYTLRYQLKE
jgi:protein TonB